MLYIVFSDLGDGHMQTFRRPLHFGWSACVRFEGWSGSSLEGFTKSQSDFTYIDRLVLYLLFMKTSAKAILIWNYLKNHWSGPCLYLTRAITRTEGQSMKRQLHTYSSIIYGLYRPKDSKADIKCPNSWNVSLNSEEHGRLPITYNRM